MTISAQFIDQIVHNVMREMQSRTTLNAPAAQQELVTAELPASKPISISSRVLSENVLAKANAAGRTISLQPGTVITPSGRDYIRKNAVQLTDQPGGADASSVGGTMIAVGPNATTSAAAAAGWKSMAAATEFDAASDASRQIMHGAVACIGGEPSIVACLLNRMPAVRAAVVTRTTNMATLVTVMNPHVVCLDSSGWSFGELLRLLRGFAKTAGIPKHWQELAGGTR